MRRLVLKMSITLDGYVARPTARWTGCPAPAVPTEGRRPSQLVPVGTDRLAEADLRAMELSGALQSRLVTVTACQSAVPVIGGPSGEVFATSTAFLAAGSACVVASLWEVNDLATAILMTRFYEEMSEGELRPPEALRLAQLWLRDLTDSETLDYVEGYPLAQRRADQALTWRRAPRRRQFGSQQLAVGWSAFL